MSNDQIVVSDVNQILISGIFNKLLDFEKLYSDVMKIDPTIRFAAIQNNIHGPLDQKHLLILTTEISTDHTNVIKKILELVSTNSK